MIFINEVFLPLSIAHGTNLRTVASLSNLIFSFAKGQVLVFVCYILFFSFDRRLQLSSNVIYADLFQPSFAGIIIYWSSFKVTEDMKFLLELLIPW